MVQDYSIARQYTPIIDAKTAERFAIQPQFRLATDGDLSICYAPFDHIETRARLVVVGITPGMTQAKNAHTATHGALARGASLEAALAEAKVHASFSGPMRANLVAMLDAIGIASHLSVDSTAKLFRPGSRDIHFTSALRYPVFLGGKNYGGSPAMLRHPALRKMIDTHLVEEACALPNALWLPLGPRVEEVLVYLADRGALPRQNIISGLPHPSGANAERIAVFLGRKDPARVSRQTQPGPLLESFQRLRGRFGGAEGAAV